MGHLVFGTGGIRALMGEGPDKLNCSTIRRISKGLADYVNEVHKKGSICIGYDVRHNSRLFAEEAARTFAGQQIQVHLFQDVSPTPLVSFACRLLRATAAVMITASHNPAAYNGYKVYWSDGGQLVPPHDLKVMQAVEKVSLEEPILLAPLNSSLIHPIGDEMDALYLQEIKKLQLEKSFPLHIVYSNLHGTGLRLVPKALKSWGYGSVHLVKPQTPYDGSFAEAISPNPEDLKALEIGSKQLLREKGDLFLATDPDADRVGAVIRNGASTVALTGNQTAAICLDHILSQLQAQNKLPPHATCIKTIVTTELFAKIAAHYGVGCLDVLTGFKYIGEKMTAWEQNPNGPQFIFGAEESYGCLFGTYVRDKDAISASCLIAEVAASAKRRGHTLLDYLYHLYARHGIHREKLKSLGFAHGAQGMHEMGIYMHRLRTNPPQTWKGQLVCKIEDYLAKDTGLPQSDVLRFWLKNGTKLVIRPSGTEPKIKIYAEVVFPASSPIEEAVKKADNQLDELMSAVNSFYTNPYSG